MFCLVVWEGLSCRQMGESVHLAFWYSKFCTHTTNTYAVLHQNKQQVLCNSVRVFVNIRCIQKVKIIYLCNQCTFVRQEQLLNNATVSRSAIIFQAEIRTNILVKQNKSTTIHHDTRSISKNCDEFLIFLSSMKAKFEIIVFFETWYVLDESNLEIKNCSIDILENFRKQMKQISLTLQLL